MRRLGRAIGYSFGFVLVVLDATGETLLGVSPIQEFREGFTEGVEDGKRAGLIRLRQIEYMPEEATTTLELT